MTNLQPNLPESDLSELETKFQNSQSNQSNSSTDIVAYNQEVSKALADKILNKNKYITIQEALESFQINSQLSPEERKPIINFLKIHYKQKIKTDASANKIITKFINDKTLTDVLGTKPANGQEYIELYCKAFHIELQRNGTYKQISPRIKDGNDEEARSFIDELKDSKKIEDKIIGSQLDIKHNTNWTLDYFLAMVRTFAAEHYNSLLLTNKNIEDGHLIWHKNKHLQLKQDLYESIAYRKIDPGLVARTGNHQSPVLTFDELWDITIELLTDNDQALAKAALQHFIWQVKRKIIGQEVTYHLMPIIVGKQDMGKTKFFQKFLAPVQYIETGFAQVLDDASVELFEQNYIIWLDEMQGVKKADIQQIKNLITTETKSTRLFHTQKTTVVKQNATFIGSANDDISDMIRDNTGMRRFYQIQFKKINPEDYNTINNVIPWVALWQSVNEFGPPPILPFKQQLSEIQEEYRELNMSSVEHWLNSLDEDKTFEFGRKYQAKDLFINFHEYDKQFFYGNVTVTPFGLGMKKEYKGFKIIKSNYGGKVFYIIERA